ncbi:hypothetical protein Tco_0957785 [Tanacetum coccineum]
MICRMWDVNDVTGCYLSTDFVMFDVKGNVMHYTARGNITHNFLRLKERGIYLIKNFVVLPNKDEYRIIKNDTFMLEFVGATTIRKALVKPDGFLRFRLELGVFNDTIHDVVVMFDETTTDLVKCSVKSILEVEDEINPTEVVEESVGYSTVDAVPAIQAPLLKRLSRRPSVSTPSKPMEGKKNKRIKELEWYLAIVIIFVMIDLLLDDFAQYILKDAAEHVK